MNLRKDIISTLKEYNLKVFPLKDKRPAVSNWKNYVGEIKEEQPFGIVLGGESKIFVIDVDDYSLIPHFEQFLDKTYVVKTGKGFHIFVKANTLPQTMRLDNNQSQHIDIQSTGTYVVGETSKHYANNNGNYKETGKIYEKISSGRVINYIDFETEIKPILEKFGFDLTKKPVKEELREAVINGINEGNRNISLFKLACHLLSSKIDSSVVYDEIMSINQKSPKPLDEEEVKQLFQSALSRTSQEISDSNQKFKITDKVEYKIPKELREEIRADILEYIIQVCSKEIKEEDSNIKQITLTFLSSYTNNPMNLRILAPSGEGKTYLVTQIAKLFPEENVVILAKATAQSWKYNFITKKLVENGTGNWQDYEIAVKPLEEQLAKTKNKEEQDKIQQQIRELQDSSCDLVDFTHKTIILVDSQSFELFENIKTTLSHDQDNIKSYSVNKSKSGTIQGQKFIIRGFPAVIYCSAKDEQKKDETNEINTRFNTISLNTNSKKYRKMLDFEAIKSSIPDFIYQEDIVSQEDFDELKYGIRQLTEEIQNDNEILNPYAMGISTLMKSDAGYRTRQLKILNNNIRLHTLANSKNRPRIIHDGKKIPITIKLDIEKACILTKEPLEIQTYKIKIFNEQIRPVLLEINKQKSLVEGEQKGLTASELVEILEKTNTTVDRQRLQETILKPLAEHGYLEKAKDERNRARDIYYLSPRYIENQASFESTLIDVSAIDSTCPDSHVNQYLKQRFDSGKITIEDEKGNPITIEELIELLHSIDVRCSQNTY